VTENNVAGGCRDLPPPATRVEMYLAAILDEIQALRRDLGRPLPTRAELMQIRGVGERTASEIVELLEGREG
jgi:endonuclease III